MSVRHTVKRSPPSQTAAAPMPCGRAPRGMACRCMPPSNRRQAMVHSGAACRGRVAGWGGWLRATQSKDGRSWIGRALWRASFCFASCVTSCAQRHDHHPRHSWPVGIHCQTAHMRQRRRGDGRTLRSDAFLSSRAASFAAICALTSSGDNNSRANSALVTLGSSRPFNEASVFSRASFSCCNLRFGTCTHKHAWPRPSHPRRANIDVSVRTRCRARSTHCARRRAFCCFSASGAGLRRHGRNPRTPGAPHRRAHAHGARAPHTTCHF